MPCPLPYLQWGRKGPLVSLVVGTVVDACPTCHSATCLPPPATTWEGRPNPTIFIFVGGVEHFSFGQLIKVGGWVLFAFAVLYAFCILVGLGFLLATAFSPCLFCSILLFCPHGGTCCISIVPTLLLNMHALLPSPCSGPTILLLTHSCFFFLCCFHLCY